MTAFARLLRSKTFVWIVLILPGLWPAWPLFVRQDSSALADPLKFILHHLGFVACLLLVTVLTFSPLRVLFPRSPVVQALNRHRRLVGVSAFVYAALHFTTHLLYEGGAHPANLPGIFRNVLDKPFQLTGLIALTILLLLAVTSLHAAVRWLGGRRWKNLHRLAYVAAALIAYHQAAARKIFPVQVLWIFIPLVVLELLRLWKTHRPRPAPAAARP
ncbi:ferric reductase-like transmembrane domain-containing protein [Horticoccus luteus]|uniref:Ferric reductase-like transmembrane domain-containing protein n=1 Tax=Horticoccus luteus TaxID=2862869 RepID=A0A8F9XGG4_9BACT|nr:ferric reductase-like transmembrane domain-containing protein [Horticoccus luteus]QYM79177.1 ferric reductase-like transmembrane domain-containing protein [Horticoccus luteus]